MSNVKSSEIEEIEIIPEVTASAVLGQPDFHCSQSNRGGKTCQGNSFNQPWGICKEGERLFVTDNVNNRVLVWNRVENDRAADLVLGQATFNDSLVNRGRDSVRFKEDWLVGSESWSPEVEIIRPDTDTLSGPSGVSVAGEKLFVADTDNHRVLIWNGIPAENGKGADVVIGQPDFVSGTANRDGNFGAASLFSPVGVFSDGIRVFVVDKDNHRVLIWNRIPRSNGEEADLVVGQPDLKSRMHNAGRLDKSGPDTLAFPTGVFYDGLHLFVVDQGNHRILIWNHLPQRNGEPATMMLGQKDFIERAANRGGKCSVCSLRFPSQVFRKGGDLYVVDQGNNRILVWKSFSWKEKESADLVIGQPNLDTNEHHWRLVKVRDRSQEFLKIDLADGPNSFTLWDPSMVWVDEQDRILIVDRCNNRVVIWNELPRLNI